MTPADAAPPACPACSGETAPLADLPAGPAWRCRDRRCRLAFVSPQPDPAILDHAYRAHYFPEGGDGPAAAAYPPSIVARERTHLEFLGRRLDLRAVRVLDFGCGTGPFMEAARERGSDVVGIERDAVARDVAGAKGHRVHATLDDLPDAAFGLIYMNDVLEHLRDPVSTVAELAGRLDGDGILFVSTINADGLKARLQGAQWDMMQDPTHLFFPTEGALVRMLGAAGLGRIERVRIPFRYPHHGPARRLLQAGLVRIGLESTLKLVCAR